MVQFMCNGLSVCLSWGQRALTHELNFKNTCAWIGVALIKLNVDAPCSYLAVSSSVHSLQERIFPAIKRLMSRSFKR